MVQLGIQKLVFTVATGRCGTAFFAEILRLVPGVVSLHEPEPEYADVLRDIQEDPDKARSFLLDRKLPAIADIDSTIYIETSHLFCKGFLEPLLELKIVPAILWIRRDHRAVASSMFRGGTIPGRTEKGLQFYLSPDDYGVLAIPGWQNLHDYQLCFWYCLEIERRALSYRNIYQQNNWLWAETSLAHINTVAGLRQVIDKLELPKLNLLGWMRYLNNRRRKVNPTSKDKQRVTLPPNLDGLEQEVMELAAQ
ncbi:hypothetical protein ACFL0S_02695 [Thermodesulfobacteriota bacterium]